MGKLKNIELICDNCMDKRKKEMQKVINDINLKVGDYVKIALTDDNGTEHMWFIIQSINNDRSITGKLDNDPLFLECELGDIFHFKKDDIEQYIPGQ